MSIPRKLCIALAALIAAFLTGSLPANAATNPATTTAATETTMTSTTVEPLYDFCAGQRKIWSWGLENYVCHFTADDLTYNCDVTADGHHAVVLWKRSSGGTVYIDRNTNGAGYCTYMGQNEPLYLKSCVGEGSTYYNCTTTWVYFARD
jgi:FlaG/FlaF family flagellin (archaellin)